MQSLPFAVLEIFWIPWKTALLVISHLITKLCWYENRNWTAWKACGCVWYVKTAHSKVYTVCRQFRTEHHTRCVTMRDNTRKIKFLSDATWGKSEKSFSSTKCDLFSFNRFFISFLKRKMFFCRSKLKWCSSPVEQRLQRHTDAYLFGLMFHSLNFLIKTIFVHFNELWHLMTSAIRTNFQSTMLSEKRIDFLKWLN